MFGSPPSRAASKSRTARVLFVATIVACVLSIIGPRELWAHQAGVSQGRYALKGATVVGEIVFANAELANALVALDEDGSGAISTGELDRGGAVLSRNIVDRIRVTGDGRPCPSKLVSATLTEQDGVDLRFAAVCAFRPARVALHFGFLDVLSSAHRHLAVMTSDGPSSARETIAVRGKMDVSFAVDAAVDDAPHGDGSSRALLRLGIEHILTGYDHLVFLFGLILLGGRARSLVAALTAFTLSHSLSLALAIFGVWTPRPSIVEPAIALSIAYVGAENLWRMRRRDDASARAEPGRTPPDDPARDRWRITFPFGLVHGFGFAGALAEIGLPRGRIPGALLAFNLGVELGQLAVLAIVLPLLMWARRSRAVRGPMTTAANVAIVVAGVVWLVARLRA